MAEYGQFLKELFTRRNAGRRARLAEEMAVMRREKPVNTFYFGEQKIVTKVYMMAPAERDYLSVDVADYTWEQEDAYAI